MSAVVIVVLRLLCCLLLPSKRVVDCKIEVHRRTSLLPSFPSFFLSFPLLLLFVLVWVILSQLKSLFFFFWVFLGLFLSCFWRFFVRATDGVPLFLNGFVEELGTALAAPRGPNSKPEPSTESRNIALHDSHMHILDLESVTNILVLTYLNALVWMSAS